MTLQVLTEPGDEFERETRIIVAAAIMDTQTGNIYTMLPPARHHTIMREMFEIHAIIQEVHHEQGFLTSDGFFVRRKPACVIAEQAGQLIRKTNPKDTLFSEDLW